MTVTTSPALSCVPLAPVPLAPVALMTTLLTVGATVSEVKAFTMARNSAMLSTPLPSSFVSLILLLMAVKLVAVTPLSPRASRLASVRDVPPLAAATTAAAPLAM